jgi:membrane fusion protein (multidrug efflux system)
MTVFHEQRARALVFNAAIVAASGGMLASGLLAGCGKHVSAASPSGHAMGPMKVAVVKAAQSDVPLTGEWVGTLDGYVNAQIQPQANGYLIRQNYREGIKVKKDQVLFEIDPRPF